MIESAVRPYMTSTKQLLITLILTLLPGSYARSADQDVMSDDGREVLLKEDGTWAFRSTDRYAYTKDGKRVRLKADNTWEYTGKRVLISNPVIRTTTDDIELQKVVIEIHKEKVHKNVRTVSQTVFYLNVNVSPGSEGNLTLSRADLSRIQVRDNKGNSYRVLSATADAAGMSPDSEQTVSIRVEGSPSIWSDARSMELELLPDVFGIKEAVILNLKIRDIEKERVDGFE